MAVMISDAFLRLGVSVCLAGTILLAGPPAVPAAVTTFFDGDFAPAHWTRLEVDRNQGGAVNSELVADGAPGNALRIAITINPATEYSEITGVFLWHVPYDPAVAGGIGAFDYAENARRVQATGQGQSTGIALRQNGSIFVHRVGTAPMQPWATVAKDAIGAADFSRIAGSGTLDLSSGGGPIEVGFYRANSHPPTGGGQGLQVVDIDNWRVRVRPTCGSDLECDDANRCTDDTCAEGVCRTVAGDCGLGLEMDDGNHSWTEGPIIPFEITVTNTGATPISGLGLHDAVPVETVFRTDGSTPGWQCPDGPTGGNLCILEIGDLGVGESRVATFTVEVATDTPSSWDVYNEVGVVLEGAVSPTGVSVEVRRPGRAAAALTETAAPGSCLLPVLQGAGYPRCAHDCSEAAEAACWEEYEKYLLDAGADRSAFHSTCCLARIIARVVCAAELYNCGDGVKQLREQCDDGNTINGDECDNNCTRPRCGNFAVDPTEECDDGPTGSSCCSETSCRFRRPDCRATPAPALRPAGAGGAPPPNPIDLRVLYALRDGNLGSTPGGRRAIVLYYRHSADLVRAALAEPALVALGRDALAAWRPVLEGLVTGESTAVTLAQLETLNTFLTALEPVASPSLRRALDDGRARLQVGSWFGLTPSQVLERLDTLECGAAPTFPSIGCRVDDLVAIVEGDIPARPYRDRLQRTLVAAAAKVAHAEELTAEGKTGPARRALRVAGGRLTTFGKNVRSRRGRREVPEAVRTQLVALLEPLREDVKQLRARRGSV